jgi:RNA polymerase sigma-70 factor, ECF subfamily
LPLLVSSVRRNRSESEKHRGGEEKVTMQIEPAGQSARDTSNAGPNNGSVEYCEERLVAEAQGGSLPAFQRLISCYETRVFRLAKRIAHSREDAEEVVQNAFVQAFKNMSRFRGDSRFSTWLGRITINEGLMKIRGRRVKEISVDHPVETEEGIFPLELEDQRPNPEQRCSQGELQSILSKTIAQLSPTYRTVFQLREVEGFSTEETADALDVTPTAVKSRLRRARLQLRQSLNPYFKPMIGHKPTRRDRLSQPDLRGGGLRQSEKFQFGKRSEMRVSNLKPSEAVLGQDPGSPRPKAA